MYPRGMLLALLFVLAQPDSLSDPRPVVLTGADVPALFGAAPDEIRASAVRDGRLVPIPVQVDERFVYDLATVYQGLTPDDCARRSWCEDLIGHVVMLGYADPGTHVGPDPDPVLDADDEIALMLADFGPRAELAPSGTVELAATAGGVTRYAYLAADSPGLGPEAEAPVPHVALDIAFRHGPYLATYDRGGRSPQKLFNWPFGHPSRERDANNPEATTVRTAHYTAGFSDRWILDRFHLGGGPDVLDVDMIAFGPGVCWRTPYTGSLSEGGFLVHRAGPVRAIRRVVGFNSGPLVEAEWVFYARYATSQANLRVHPVPGVMSYWDLTPAMEGAHYRSSSDPLGAIVDGRRDPFLDTANLPEWETVDGPVGSYAVRHEVVAEGFAPRVEAVYRDERRPRVQACMGDRSYIGAHGVWVRSRVPNTDPREAGPGESIARLTLSRRFVFGGDPDAGLAAMAEPVTVRVTG